MRTSSRFENWLPTKTPMVQRFDFESVAVVDVEKNVQVTFKDVGNNLHTLTMPVEAWLMAHRAIGELLASPPPRNLEEDSFEPDVV